MHFDAVKSPSHLCCDVVMFAAGQWSIANPTAVETLNINLRCLCAGSNLEGYGQSRKAVHGLHTVL